MLRVSAAVVAFGLTTLLVAQQPGDVGPRVRLIYQEFDPTIAEPSVPPSLQSRAADRLWIVQFAGLPTEAGRAAVRAAGAELHGYLPDNAYVVRMDNDTAKTVGALPSSRWVGRYHPAYRLEPQLVADHLVGKLPPAQRYNIVVVDKHRDKPALAAAIQAMGGRVDDEQSGSLLFTVTLNGAQLIRAAALDQVLWIDRWTPPENDMDNARVQGGGNYVELQGGYTGSGLNVHIYEGIQATHPDFTGGAVNVRSGGGADTHGHATAGIVFGNGNSNPAVRGMAPDCDKFFTQYSSVTTSRFNVVNELVNIHEVSHTTASWGGGLTRAYTSVSADADDIVFTHDIPWTQSQSNAGTQDSRPEAWAKNVISIGGVQHFNNSNPLDDSWLAGNGSTGPAADGRIKPILCAYYDSIGTSDRTGTDGYSTGDWSSGFGGTSGATPIVAGHNVLAIQMFTDAIFGNTLRNPGALSRHVNRPHFTTLQALQIVSARQYAFTAGSTNNRREHCGWGFPDLQRMYDNRTKTLLVDETEVLGQGETSRWLVTVAPGETELKICMAYADPAANPAAAKTRINDLSLRVESPTGAVYWGNNGLQQGNYSVANPNAEDDVNTIECVFVQNPPAGTWIVDVRATLVAVDSHVETPEVDADFGLAVSGGTGVPAAAPVFGYYLDGAAGCPGSVLSSPGCAALNSGGGTLSGANNTNEYCYTVPNSGTVTVTSFDIFTSSRTGSTQTIPARLYADNNGVPSTAPIATTTMTIGPASAFYTATLTVPQQVTGTYFLGLDTSGQTVNISQLTAGASGSGFFRGTPLSGGWSQSGTVTRPSYRVNCVPQSVTPALGHVGVPVANASFSLTLAQALPFTLAVNMLGLSDQVYNGTPLPIPLPGAPGCNVRVALDLTFLTVTDANGTSGVSLFVPADPNLLGVSLFHQWLVFDPINALGIVVSPSASSRVGEL
ncbi:MAG: S8 family serine peptidase [Planctomycetota bacterium]